MKKRYKYILFEQLRRIQNEYNKYWRIESYLQDFISKILRLIQQPTTKIQTVNFRFNERQPSIRRQIDSLRFLGENNSFDERNNFVSILKVNLVKSHVLSVTNFYLQISNLTIKRHRSKIDQFSLYFLQDFFFLQKRFYR